MNIDGAGMVGVGVAALAMAPVVGEQVAAVFSALLAAAVPGVAGKGAVLPAIGLMVPGQMPATGVDAAMPDDATLRAPALPAFEERASCVVPAAAPIAAILPRPAVVAEQAAPVALVVLPTPVARDPEGAQLAPAALLPVRLDVRPVAPGVPDSAPVPDEMPVAGHVIAVKHGVHPPSQAVPLTTELERLPGHATRIVVEGAVPRSKPGAVLLPGEAATPDDDDTVDAVEVAAVAAPLPVATPVTAFARLPAQRVHADMVPDRSVSGGPERTVVGGASHVPVAIEVAAEVAARVLSVVPIADLPDAVSAPERAEGGASPDGLVAPMDGKPVQLAEKPVLPRPEAPRFTVPPLVPVPVAAVSVVTLPPDLGVDWRFRKLVPAEAAAPVAVADAGLRLAPLVVTEAQSPQLVPAAAPRTEIAVASESLGDVRIGVEGTARDLKVSLGLAPAAAAIVAADVPRLVADLAANGVRLQSLDVSGGQFGGASQSHRESPRNAPPRPMPVLTAPATAPARDRYA